MPVLTCHWPRPIRRKKWTTTQLKTAALGMPLHQNKTIFLYNTIHVFTDNASVLHIHRYKPTNSREKRSISYISQYDLDIYYIPEKNNKLADCLSRLPEDVNLLVVYFTPSGASKQEEFWLEKSLVGKRFWQSKIHKQVERQN